MIKRRKRERFGTRQETRIRCPAHLAWVRGHVCAIQDRHAVFDMSDGSRLADTAPHVCSGRMEAAHVRIGTDGALNIKPSDCWTIPLCSKAHIPLQHQAGEREFELRYGIDMKAIAAQLWASSPHRRKYEKRIRERRA